MTGSKPLLGPRLIRLRQKWAVAAILEFLVEEPET
jgi:hypothetical protein